MIECQLINLEATFTRQIKCSSFLFYEVSFICIHNITYFEFFGKKAFIANPGGSKEQTIDAIKKSLIEQKDLLDEILNSNEQNIYY